jgi:phage tail-like protein
MAIPGVGPAKDEFLVGSWFTIELKKAKIEGITEVSGLAIEIDVVDYTQVDAKGTTVSKKRPGGTKFTDITLKRPMSKDKSLFQWAKDIRDGKDDFRADGAIVLLNIGRKEVGRWTFLNAWPSKWSASDLDVGTDDPMIEEVTLTIEHLERVK